MDAIGKLQQIRINSLFSNGNGLIYKITYFIFSEAITYKYDNKPLQDNVVHADIYQEDDDGTLKVIDTITFLHIKDLHPLSIKRNYLQTIGFTEQIHENQQVLKCNNAYFENLNNVGGIYTLRVVNSVYAHPVQYIHEVQNLSP